MAQYKLSEVNTIDQLSRCTDVTLPSALLKCVVALSFIMAEAIMQYHVDAERGWSNSHPND